MEAAPTRILLVEDNPGDAGLLEAALKGEGKALYQIEKVERLSHGMERLSRGGVDLVLLDLFLPDSSGLATLKVLLQSSPQVPVVVLTGLNNQEIATESLKEGAQDFIVKDGLNPALLRQSISYSIERHRLLKKVQENEERYYLAAQGSHDGLWDWNLRTGRIYFSPRWKRLLGYVDEEIGDQPDEWLGRVHPEDQERVKRDLDNHLSGKTPHFANEHRLRRKDGRYGWVLSRGLAITDAQNRATRVAGSLTDITHHKNMEQQLALRAFYDPLTGLPNRAFFIEGLARALKRLEGRPHELFALFFLDLDRLKEINDHLGHKAGDGLLIEFAYRLRSCVRPRDMVARIGGDEFTVILENLRSHSEALEAAGRILEALSEPFFLGGKEAKTTASIGIVFSDSGIDQSDGLLQAADTAMYQAKIAGKACYRIFGQGAEAPAKRKAHDA